MAATMLSNKKNASFVLHVSSSNADNIIIAGNSSVSNVAISNEVLTGASIAQVIWGCDGNNHIQVYRGANLVSVYDSTGYIDYAGNGMSLNKDSSANVSIKFVGSANSYCIIEFQKIGGGSSDYLVG